MAAGVMRTRAFLLSCGAVWTSLVLLVCLARAWAAPPQAWQPPLDGDWQANAVLEDVQTRTDPGLGAAQGVSLRKDRVYIYGDAYQVKPRMGVIREYTLEFKPTGRVVWLKRDGKPLLIHPTGLTWHPRWGTFLGDTVNRKAVIYRLDWERMWQDGNLDRAVLDRIDDDAAVNGCRPELVTVAGKSLLASADYGDVRPEIRLYDPERLLAARRSSAPGVVVHRVLCGPFNQNLHWDEERGQLVCIQNVIAGRGWRLEVLDLGKAIADGRAWGPGVCVRTLTFAPHDELEGFRPFGKEGALFITSSRQGNLVVGKIKRVPARLSPAGTPGFGP